ncbi:tyrosine-type recombinase/integrase [Leptolyngbya ohadii]|uniref:tyrosine-type recombinase/integrase n=1 Tax=Leptolyngbya ohadii TaxID=1962290 RepID=UPI000B59A977|nr:site-specific integrase [Leptolyngbya ohadii]
MINIDWKKNYRNEFACPSCGTPGIQLTGTTKKRYFRCSECRKTSQTACKLDIREIYDPQNPLITWYRNHRFEGLICPNCEKESIYFYSIENGKKRFICRACRKRYPDSVSLDLKLISRLSGTTPPVLKPFVFDDVWDLRTVNPNFSEREKVFTVNFELIKLDWWKESVKKYVYHSCKIEASFSRIRQHLWGLLNFSYFLAQSQISSFSEIDRMTILDFISHEPNKYGRLKCELTVLRDFFYIGTIYQWFRVKQDLVRDEDYPKRPLHNPNPISDSVLRQIEANLHHLPSFIARMWIVAFFTAMRPAELALLRKECLVQEGENWKVIWQRPKTKDFHEVPVTRTIAKVIQEQQEYIQNLWSSEWDYLFCHYYGFSDTDIAHPKLQPVKRVVPTLNNPLTLAIRCLIRALDIRDENDQVAQFSPKLLRPTRLTKLFEMGHDLAVVSAWAGHQSLATTSTYYTHVSCELIEKETQHIQKALLNINGQPISYESFPKSFWENPRAHELDLAGNHINTPIYGHCALPLDEQCDKFRACYTCPCFFPTPEKLPLYIKIRDELRAKESQAKANGQDVLTEQFGRQAEQLDKVIARFQENS